MKNKLTVFMCAAFLVLFALPATNAAAAQNQWQYQNGHWNYYNASGALQKGWLFQGKKWYYLDSTGAMKTGWANIQNTWYFFDGSGVMKTGWLKDGVNWYYLTNSGAMKTGWLNDGANWYYLSNSGAMKTGWLLDGGSWYYLNNSGAMKTGWLKDGANWYYLNNSGAMKTGWLKDGASWYYLNNSGAMMTGWIKDGGKDYFLRANGSWDENARLEADNATYYTVSGTDSISSGIYKSEPNGTSTLVLKENVYSLKDISTSPIPMEDINYFYEKGSIATEDFEWAINPIKSVQAVGTDLYYTNYLFSGEYGGGMCGGGYAEIQELFKRDASGNITKLTNDKVSSITQDQFFVSGSSIYYAKVEKEAFKNFTIVKMGLTDNSKATLATSVVDFWVKQSTIYFVKDGKLHTMDLNGQNSQTVSNLNVKLYGMNGCGDANYTVSNNGLMADDYVNDESVTYFYDFATKTVNTLPVSTILDTLNGYPNILDVDVKNQRFAAYVNDYDTDETVLGIYDFNGNLIKKLKTVDYYLPGLLSIDVQKGEFLYVEGSQLKLIHF